MKKIIFISPTTVGMIQTSPTIKSLLDDRRESPGTLRESAKRWTDVINSAIQKPIENPYSWHEVSSVSSGMVYHQILQTLKDTDFVIEREIRSSAGISRYMRFDLDVVVEFLDEEYDDIMNYLMDSSNYYYGIDYVVVDGQIKFTGRF